MSIDHVGLICADLDRAIDFYHSTLGLRLRARGTSTVQAAADTAGATFDWADITLPDGHIIELITFHDRGPGTPGDGHFALAVTDIDAALARLATADVQPESAPRTLTEPGDWHGARIAFIVDPDGHRIELVERPTSRARSSDDVAAPAGPATSGIDG
jgi:catechol 2,3-dioxygenase-like lactoylglutathione lyase family enzyme